MENDGVISGIIRGATLTSMYDSLVIVGLVYSDSKGRFADGTSIKASPVISITNGIVKTRNSTYKIEGELIIA